jgi:hypothetical protein
MGTWSAVLIGAALWTTPAVVRTPAPRPSGNAARLTLGGVTILQFRAAAGGFSPEERRSELQSRVVEILSHEELNPSDVRVVIGPGGHSATVQVGPLLFVTATEADARANQSTPEELANTWAQNLRRGFAAAKPRPTPHE